MKTVDNTILTINLYHRHQLIGGRLFLLSVIQVEHIQAHMNK